MSWERHILGELIYIKKGKSITKKDSKAGPYPVVLGGREPAYYIDQFNHTGKAIVVSRSGASAGFISHWNEPIFVTDGFLIQPKENINHDFLYYLMKSHESELQGLQGGSAIPHVTPNIINNIIVYIPNIYIQENIANILSTYDDLIENNNRQIKLLEEAAQRLYKEWFVDLHFPGHENCKIVDGVPEGWRKKTVGDLIGKVPRTTQIPASCYKKNGEIPVIDQSKVFIAGYTDEKSALVDLHMPVIVFGDHTRILKYIQFPFARGADGTQLIVSRTTNMPQSLLYYGLVNIDLSNYHYARHFKYLKAESLLVPDKKNAELFDGYVSVLQEKIQDLRDEMYLSAEARDRLLPKLMSGEIEV
ncbi:restriction endonuclease subunit S [Lachnospiraceae bacterium YH-ros2228]